MLTILLFLNPLFFMAKPLSKVLCTMNPDGDFNSFPVHTSNTLATIVYLPGEGVHPFIKTIQGICTKNVNLKSPSWWR